MPYGQGYGQQRGYGGTGRSSYQYRQATPSQYESFFNPVPIEFLQRSIEKSQGQYDQAFAGALAAKEAALQQEVGLNDVVRQNEIIESGMQDMDALADQYGGDYGKAAKGIARKITEIRADPFWKSAAHLKEQQQLQQKYQLENPNAYIKNDVLSQSAYDPKTGRVRSSEELTFGGIQRSDYATSIEKQFADLKGDEVAIALQKAGKDAEGFLKYGSVTDLTDSDIRGAASEGVGAFLENNRDYVSIGLDQGKDMETIRAEAGQLIYEQIKDKKNRAEDVRYVRDPTVAQAKAGSGGTGGRRGLIFGNYAPEVQMTVDRPDVKRKQLEEMNNRIQALPEGSNERINLENEQKAMHGRVNTVIDAVLQNPTDYGVSIDGLMNEYKKFYNNPFNIDVGPEKTRGEIEQEFKDHLRNGTNPETSRYVGQATGSIVGEQGERTAGAAGGAPAVVDPMLGTLREMRKAMNKAIRDEKGITLNSNVLTGTSGDQKIDTVVQDYNDVAKKHLHETISSWSISDSGHQLDTYIAKNYGRKKNEKNRRDPKLDQVSMMDTPINGKLGFQLIIKNAAGEDLETIVISPDNQQFAKGNFETAARDIYDLGVQTGNDQYLGQAEAMIVNSQIRPVVQEANIESNTSGEIQTEQMLGQNIQFERAGTPDNPYFLLYTEDEDGNKTYRESGGQPLQLADEESISQEIYRIAQRQAAANVTQ